MVSTVEFGSALSHADNEYVGLVWDIPTTVFALLCFALFCFVFCFFVSFCYSCCVSRSSRCAHSVTAINPPWAKLKSEVRQRHIYVDAFRVRSLFCHLENCDQTRARPAGTSLGSRVFLRGDQERLLERLAFHPGDTSFY